MNYKPIVLIVFTAVYLYNLLLTIIHMLSTKNPIPANVADVYDEETYRNWRVYHAEKSRFSILTSTVSFAVDLILLAFNVYAAFARLFPDIAEGYQLYTALVYLRVPARMVVFHGENHELSRTGKPAHRLRRLEEITGWFEKYTSGKDR